MIRINNIGSSILGTEQTPESNNMKIAGIAAGGAALGASLTHLILWGTHRLVSFEAGPTRVRISEEQYENMKK